MMWFYVSILLLGFSAACAQRELESYNVDPSKISTSGISSGAAMATQFHVAYSATIMGVGMIAGPPYYCAKGSVTTGVNACTRYPNQIDVAELITETNRYETTRDIDSTSNMSDDKVFIFAGTLDTAVDPGCMMKAEEYYRNYVNVANIKSVYNIAANHGQPTINYGVECTIAASPYINRCNYDAAFEILDHIYGGLQRPSGSVALNGDFYEYSQDEFFLVYPPSVSSMDDIGYVYVPSRCTSRVNVCKLHVVFHGCVQGRHAIGDEFARNAGHNEVGELNNIIMLYPQAKASLSNPNGCWDWWGYTFANYATNSGSQMQALFRMVEKVAA